jgi:predicted RNase H-like nuclease (RuvC/YqgF family)
MMGIVKFDYDESVERAMTHHQRKVSQLECLKKDLGLYFDEDEAERIARETMKEINPTAVEAEHISVQSIVENARRDHKRKVSQFAAIKSDIGQYFDDQEASQLAAEMMKEFNPNDRSGKPEPVTVDQIVDRAVREHNRKKSQFSAIKDGLGLIYDKEDVEVIAKNVMKRVFSNKTQDLNQTSTMQQGYVENLERKVSRLEQQLQSKESEIEQLMNRVQYLEDNKCDFAIRTNQSLNEMRDLLSQYHKVCELKLQDKQKK